MNQNSYLHRDTLDGRKLTIAVNQPITAVESQGLTQAGRLRKFMRVNRARYLLVQKDLAWCTERRAVIVGAQCLDWHLPDTSTLICWPLDNAVFFASLTSEGFNMIEADSEMICSCDAALEVLGNSNTSVLIIPGGALSTRLEVAGYPPNAADEQALLDLSRYCTRSSMLMFTQLRLPHPTHVFLLLLIIGGFGTQKLLLGTAGDEDSGQVLQVIEPPSGTPGLVDDLRAVRAATRDLTVLTLHGLSTLSYESGTGKIIASGQIDFDNLLRINEIARELDKSLEVTGNTWRLTYTLPVTQTRKQPLRSINSEVERLVQLGRAAGFSVSITGYKEGGPPISLDRGFRLVSRDYVEVGLMLTADSRGSMAATALLLSRLTTLDPQPNAILSASRFEMAEFGLMSLALTILVRGQKQHSEGKS